MITLLAIGSRGDVQPYIALGNALRQVGQEVRIATFAEFKALAEGAGLAFFPVKGDITSVASTLQKDPAMRADNPFSFLRSFNRLKKYAAQVQGDLFDACEGADAVVYHPGAVIGHFAAQHFKVPGILASPYPMVATKQYPSLIFYGKMNLGGNFNVLTHKFFQRMLWTAGAMPTRQFWCERFGKVPDNFRNFYLHLEQYPSPVIISGSPQIYPSPEDCPEHIHYTGYWFYDEDTHWEPSAELLDFLEEGPEPVYVGFGSMGNPAEKNETTRIVIDALQKAGQRGVLATGWSGMERLEHVPNSILMIDHAPHAWLFPQMAAVVHHGGAGTSAASFRAGVPCVIVPYGMDQYAWGKRAYELGVGAAPLPRKKLTADNLSEAIRFTQSPEIRAQAAALGDKIRAENGAARAAQIIIEFLQSR
jgi:sterol 3beta-glucosyltransferase